MKMGNTDDTANSKAGSQADAIFFTMRSNLAMVEAFERKSMLATNESDLGFFGLKSGKEQTEKYNQSIAYIEVALLCQTLSNYCEIKEIKPQLKDVDVEEFLNKLEDRNEFIERVTAIRNGIFHVPNNGQQRRTNMVALEKICNQHKGVAVVMSDMRKVLYAFTEKIFSGELKMWSATAEDLERMKKENPGIFEKLRTGEVGLSEVLEAIERTKEEKR